MALFTADSKNVFGQTVEEAGTYNVVVAPSSQFTNSKQTGKPMAVFDYEVTFDELYMNLIVRVRTYERKLSHYFNRF